MKKIKYSLITILLLLVFNVNYAYAQTLEFTECEYSDKYEKWLQLSEAEREKIPKPEKCTSIINNKYGSPTTIPNKYNLASHDLVMRMENQGNGNSCWAFAATESLESNFLKGGHTGIELSQAHMELLTQNSNPINGWKTFNRQMDSGANSYIAAAYILNYWGPIKASDLEYTSYLDYLGGNNSAINLNNLKGKKPILDMDNFIHISNEQGACPDNTIESVKRYILENGAVAASIYMDDDSGYLALLDDNKIYILGDYTNGPYLYYNGDKLSTHAVTIVGWDDTVETTAFSNVHQPSRNGAWIVKNSYGETMDVGGQEVQMGIGGYYLVSYDDVNICTDLSGFYNVDENVSENAYFYDYLGTTIYSRSSVDRVFLANKFSKKTSKKEKIDKITFGTASNKQKYNVYYSSTGDLNSYKKIASGTADGTGYMSVVPNEKISISDNFAIIVELYDESYVPFAMQSTGDNYFDTYEIPDNVSYVSLDGATWEQAQTSGTKLLSNIRLYTSETTEPETTPSGEEQTTPSEEKTEIKVNTNDGQTTTNTETTESPVTEEKTEVENPKTGISFPIVIALIGIVAVVVIKYVSKKKNKFERV